MNAEGPQFESLSGIAEFADAAIRVIGNARYELALMSVHLDAKAFASEAFVERLREFILSHRRARLRVLLHDPRSAISNSIRLVEFGRLLTSRIEFRECNEEACKLPEEYLIADEVSVLHRGAPDQLDAKYYADAPRVARSQLKAFNAIWDECVVARELSALGI